MGLVLLKLVIIILIFGAIMSFLMQGDDDRWKPS